MRAISSSGLQVIGTRVEHACGLGVCTPFPALPKVRTRLAIQSGRLSPAPLCAPTTRKIISPRVVWDAALAGFNVRVDPRLALDGWVQGEVGSAPGCWCLRPNAADLSKR